jgi:carbonic anhydrase
VKPIELRALFALGLFAGATAAQGKVPSADVVLRELKAGNDHHVGKRYRHPHETAARQRELASTQNPQAGILSCADSRVTPEIIFDQGLGDLFDVRVAGNIAGDAELASLEYAAEHLNVPLLVVYSLDTGKIDWLPQTPASTGAARLLDAAACLTARSTTSSSPRSSP